MSNCEQSSNGRPEPWRRKIFRAATHCIPPCSRDHDRTPRVGTLVVARTTAATGSIIGRIKLTTLVRAPLPANASFAHGAYLTGGEIVPSSGLQTDRTITLVGFESEYAFRYTRLAGEVIHDTFATPSGHVGATTWFVEGQQTIPAAPRWYVAGRHEGTSAPVVGAGVIFGAQPTMLANEATAGFRVNRDVLLKASYYTRRPYGRIGDWDHQAAVQAVWDHRWW